MRKFIVVGIACFLGVRLSAQVIPAERTVNWKLAGIRGNFNISGKTIDFIKAGGIPDGKTPNDSVFASIVSNLGSDSAVIYFAKGNYFFTAPVVLQSGIVIRGFSNDSTSLIFRLTNADHLIKLAGSESPVKISIDGKLYKDSSSVKVIHSTGLSVGDYVKITENDSALVASSWAWHTTGQIVRIEGINDSMVFFSSPLRRSYSGGNAMLVKLNMVGGAGVENMKIVRLDSTAAQTSNIFLQYAANCHIKCIESVNCNFAHIELNNCTNIEVTGSYMHRAFNYGDGGEGYGVVAHLTTGECLIENNSFDSLRHAMLVQAGANGNVFAYNYSTNAVWAEKGFPVNAAGDITLHGNYGYANLFEGNVVQNIVIDNSHGTNGPFNTFYRNRALLYGFVMAPRSGDGQNFLGNEITNNGFLLGNFILNGTDNYQYGNNQHGVILPSGSNDPLSASLFLTSAPEYYTYKATWPPIGPPNSIDKNMTEVQDFGSRGFFTECSYPVQAVDTTKKDTAKTGVTNNSQIPGFLDAFPNPASSDVHIAMDEQSKLSVKEVTVFSCLGQQVLKISNSDIIGLGSLANGLYILDIKLSDGTHSKVRILKESN